MIAILRGLSPCRRKNADTPANPDNAPPLAVIRLLLARLTAAGTQAITLVALTNHLGISDFGRYATLLAVGTFATPVLGLGIASRCLRLAGEGLAHQTSAHLAIGFLGSVGSGLVALLVSHLYEWGLTSWAIAAATFSTTEYYITISQNVLLGELAQGRAEILTVARRLLPLLGLGFGLYSNSTGLILGYIVGMILACILSFFLVGIREWHGWLMPTVIREGLHFWQASIWNSLQQLDVIFIQNFFGPSLAGAYAAAIRLASPTNIPTGAITSSLAPRLSRAKDSATRDHLTAPFLRLSKAYSLMLLVLSPCLIYIGPAILGESFDAFNWVFPIALIATGLSVISQLQMTRLYAESRMSSVSWAVAGSTVAFFFVIGLGTVLAIGFISVCAAVVNQIILMTLLHLLIRRHPTLPRGETS